jgi:hypothetical protein
MSDCWRSGSRRIQDSAGRPPSTPASSPERAQLMLHRRLRNSATKLSTTQSSNFGDSSSWEELTQKENTVYIAYFLSNAHFHVQMDKMPEYVALGEMERIASTTARTPGTL